MNSLRCIAMGLLLACSGQTWVSAESSGWILWYRTTVESEQDQAGKVVQAVQTLPDWEPVMGFEQLAECRREAMDAFPVTDPAAEKAKIATLTYPISISSRFGSSVTFERKTPSGGKRQIRVGAVCFPGGFDPRSR